MNASTPSSGAIAFGPADAATAIGLSRAQLYKLLSRGDLPSVKLGSRRLILRSDIENFLASLRRAG